MRSASHGKIGNILVVDDEETMRRSLADILRLEGFQVQAVSSGEAALEILRKEEFDVMLLDLKMPGMDGMDVLRNASRLAPDTMVILLTAHGSFESAVEAIRFQAHDYLVKPATTQQILSSVTKAMSRRSELLHKRLLIEQKEAADKNLPAGENRPGQGEKAGSTPGAEGLRESVWREMEPRLIQLSSDVLVDLSRREIWRRENQAGRERPPGEIQRGQSAPESGAQERGAQSGSQSLKVKLTPTEAKLLKVLLENRGRVLTHRELVLMVQGYEVTDWEAPEVLRPLVSRLRQKLSHFPEGESWVVNVRGTGYVLERRLSDRGPKDGVERRIRPR